MVQTTMAVSYTHLARRKVLANASTIRERISQSYALLSGGDDAPGAVDLLGEASNAIDGARCV